MTKDITKRIFRDLDWLLVPTGMIRQDVIQTNRNQYNVLSAVGATLLEIARDGFYTLLLHDFVNKYFS